MSGITDMDNHLPGENSFSREDGSELSPELLRHIEVEVGAAVDRGETYPSSGSLDCETVLALVVAARERDALLQQYRVLKRVSFHFRDDGQEYMMQEGNPLKYLTGRTAEGYSAPNNPDDGEVL